MKRCLGFILGVAVLMCSTQSFGQEEPPVDETVAITKIFDSILDAIKRQDKRMAELEEQVQELIRMAVHLNKRIASQQKMLDLLSAQRNIGVGGESMVAPKTRQDNGGE